jgi:hypothetical protein
LRVCLFVESTKHEKSTYFSALNLQGARKPEEY